MGRRSARLGQLGGLLAALAALPGCAEELGRDAPPTATVSGVVLDAGRPVAGGWIEFSPVEGTRGNLRSAPVGPDGTFAADGVPIGEVAVGLVAVKAGRTDPRLFDTLRTTIRRTIAPGPNPPLGIDLLDEMLRAQAEAARTRG